MCVWPPINRCFAILLICVVSAVLPPLAGKVVAGDPQATGDILIVRTDTRLDPTKKYGQIRIESSDVTLDGAGAWLVGVSDGEPKSYRHTALALEGVSNVVIRNVRAKGWETGLHLRDCKAVLVEDCDFSDNFHDPAFGWGENGRRGGVLLERVSNSIIRRTQAHRVWDACVLVDSDRNLLESNDFSHTSNTCLKLWNSSHNVIRDNNLSYGLRIDPGEVHARDSTCVLIESGSNDNRLERNDCTHGGDGIFVRVLNQWVSTGNLFLENDCSYANNNCVEAWSPRNTWIRNKANHGSYGFWLGASDQNTLIGNEASYNGLHTGFHNSPHLPGEMHAGIVFMFGPSSHTLLQGNRCEGNHGAGIAAIGDLESRGGRWNAFHWVAQQNELIKNRWGIYLQHAEMIDLRANRYDQNEIADVWNAENVNEFVRKADPEQGTQTASEPPQVDLQGPTVVRVGEATTWSAEGSRDKDDRPLQYRWRIQSADQGSESRFVATLRKPGFYRLALTIDNGQLANLAWRDLYAVELIDEMGTEGGPEVAGQWSCVEADSKGAFAIDNQVKLVGEGSMSARVDPYSGGRVTLRYRVPGTGLSLAGNSHLTLWLKTRNENVPGWQDVNPLIGLTDTAGETRKLTPVRDLLSAPIANESREGWSYFTIPVDGNAEWKAEGPIGEKIAVIECGFDSWGAPPLKIWIDGLGFRSVDGDE